MNNKKLFFFPDYTKNNSYCIVIPPPNITGYLHMGHAFQCTLMDILVRYYRMNSFSVLWKMGVDHAGIATQILMEKKFSTRDKNLLLKLSYKWKKKSFKKIKSQLSKLDCSLCFKTSRFTLDNHFSYAVRYAFISLYNDGLIYRSKKLVNWDVEIKSAISDLEIVYTEENVNLYYIRYKIVGETNYLIISTTRPETIFADTAVALNISDLRFSFLLGKTLEVPITKHVIPVIFDSSVDINFGSGCLKVTPGHDFSDFDLGIKHKLPVLNILDKNGLLNDKVPYKYQGMTLLNARNEVVNDLAALGLIEKIVMYKTKIPRADRTGSIIEPVLTDQWYVKTKPLIEPVLTIIKDNKIRIRPLKWKKNFIELSENIKDWCISRQIWWGHRIPVWYTENLDMYVGENETAVRKNFNMDDSVYLYQDLDVLDTWFSSALWPLASLGWPINKKEFTRFYPTDTLVTGFDIIFFWVIRMLMFGIKFTNQIPFREVYIHGLIRDSFGNKMSKTKGNVIDPIDIIKGIGFNDLVKKRISNLMSQRQADLIINNTKKNFPDGIKAFGVDALRLTFVSLATSNMFLKLDLKTLSKYNKFCIKILNASKFISVKTSVKIKFLYKYNVNIVYNIWIFSVWQRIKRILNIDLKNRNFSNFLHCIYSFFWNDFCDWYIEISKILVKSLRYNFITIKNLNEVFFEILITLQPVIPNLINKIIYECKYEKSCENFFYPKPKFKFVNFEKENIFILLKDICLKIRNFKSLINYENLIIFINFYTTDMINILEKIKPVICNICNISDIFLLSDLKVKGIRIFFINFYLVIPLCVDKEFNFIKNKIEKMKKEKEFIESKLRNPKFLEHADFKIVNDKRKKLEKINADLLSLETVISI